MKSYLYGAIALAVIMGLTTSHYKAYSAGKQSVLAQLQNDRITVLKDGKEIDDSVLAADDDALFCLLVNCQTD